MGVKASYLEALLDTPVGIKEFLDVGAPVFIHFDPPSTVDEAQIAQGTFAYNLNEWLCKFGANGSNTGLKLVPLLLRIGSHNPIAVDILLSGLEYLTDSAANQEFEIVEPVAAKEYAPGDIRIIVKAKDKIRNVKVSITFETSFDAVDLTPDNGGKMFYGYARCQEKGDYVFDVTATFADDANTEKTSSVQIKITDDGDTVVDITEFNMAAEKVKSDADGFIGGGGESGGGGASGSWETMLETDIAKLIGIIHAL